MSDEFSKVFYNFKWVLNEEALKKSIDNSQDYLLAELLTRIIASLRDVTPRYFQEYLGNLINIAVAFGWKACKDLVDVERLLKKIKEELDKDKYSSYIK